jgi:hypothetical protein
VPTNTVASRSRSACRYCSAESVAGAADGALPNSAAGLISQITPSTVTRKINPLLRTE